MNDHPQDTQPQRVVAIIGRPNVGKSALFNRMIGRRLAIVHEQEGVTRDRLIGEVVWEDQRFEVIDTGGIGLMDQVRSGDLITDCIVQQAEAAIEDASVLVLVVDLQTGIKPMDLEVARLVRSGGRTVFVAANKADNDDMADTAGEFDQLGYPVFPVSAMHNLGVEELMQAVLEKLPRADERYEEEHPLKVAAVGRPNAGKSSYINRLLRSDRVIVSDVPGTTRDSVEVPFCVGTGAATRHYLLIDTAGIKQRRKVKNTVEYFSMVRAEKSIEKADVVVVLLDAEKGPSSQEKKIASLVLNKKKGCLLVVNKWDLAVGITTQRQYGKALSEALPFLGYVPVMFISAKSGYNIRKSIEAIDHVASQVRATLTTGVLNRVLQDAFQRYQPPIVRNKRLKLYYAAQLGVQPVRIRLYVNNENLRNSNYEAYLQNCLRRAFGLEGAPLVLEYISHKKRPKPPEA